MEKYSPSKITTYMDCPLKFKLRYIDKIETDERSPNLAFGSAVHGTLKFWHRRLMNGERLTMEQLEDAFREDWEAQQTVPIAWNGATPEELEAQGIGLIRTYLEAENYAPPLAVEQEMTAPLVNLVTGEIVEGVEIHGFIDRILADGSPAEVKTSSRSWSQSQADLSLQMTVYAYLLAYQRQQDEVRGLFEVLVKNKTPKLQLIETVRTGHDFDQLFRTLQGVIRCIEAGAFYPNPGMFCGGCDYAEQCGKW